MNKCRRVGMALCMSLLAVSVSARHRAKRSTGRSQTAAVPSDTTSSQSTPAISQDPSYVIGPEDVLDISVWKENDFSRTVSVRPDGKVSLPLLNDVQAAGLTPTQLAASLAMALRKYITQPQVTIILKATNSQRVYVLGQVGKQGPIPILPNMTMLQALSAAGGLNQFANQKRIYILRNEGGKQVRYPFNYKQAIRGEAGKQNLILKAGDTIVVP